MRLQASRRPRRQEEEAPYRSNPWGVGIIPTRRSALADGSGDGHVGPAFAVELLLETPAVLRHRDATRIASPGHAEEVVEAERGDHSQRATGRQAYRNGRRGFGPGGDGFLSRSQRLNRDTEHAAIPEMNCRLVL